MSSVESTASRSRGHGLGHASIAAAFLLVAGITTLASAQERAVTLTDFETERVYSPFADRDYPDEVLFGDTHFHTNLSSS